MIEVVEPHKLHLLDKVVTCGDFIEFVGEYVVYVCQDTQALTMTGTSAEAKNLESFKQMFGQRRRF